MRNAPNLPFDPLDRILARQASLANWRWLLFRHIAQTTTTMSPKIGPPARTASCRSKPVAGHHFPSILHGGKRGRVAGSAVSAAILARQVRRFGGHFGAAGGSLFALFSAPARRGPDAAIFGTDPARRFRTTPSLSPAARQVKHWPPPNRIQTKRQQPTTKKNNNSRSPFSFPFVLSLFFTRRLRANQRASRRTHTHTHTHSKTNQPKKKRYSARSVRSF